MNDVAKLVKFIKARTYVCFDVEIQNGKLCLLSDRQYGLVIKEFDTLDQAKRWIKRQDDKVLLDRANTLALRSF